MVLKNSSFNDPLYYVGDSTSTFTMEKKASNSQFEIAKSLNDVLFAGTNVLQEELELENNIKSLMNNDEFDYIYMENLLASFGYSKEKIRKKFQYMTKIDPVSAFLDVENYTKPPVTVPRFNYGWGASKSSDYDYFYITPFLNSFVIYAKKGYEEIITDKKYPTLIEAREELKKLVDESKESNPHMDLAKEIIQRISSLKIPATASSNMKSIYSRINEMPSYVSRETKINFIKSQKQDNLINDIEESWLVKYAEDESENENEMDIEQLSEDVTDIKDKMESEDFNDIMDSIQVPQVYFDNLVDQRNDKDIKDITMMAYEKVEEIIENIAGYELEIVSEITDKKDTDPYTDTFNNASVKMVFKILDEASDEESVGIIVFPILEGKLTFSGKFKGKNNREYGFSQEGFQDYFDDITGLSAENIENELVKRDQQDEKPFERTHQMY